VAQLIRDVVRAPSSHVFRRLFMKRVLSAGGYEADWLEITEFVTSWGTIKESYGDNLYTGEYEVEAVNVGLDNSKAKFNSETDTNSLFFGFATRINTRFKIDIGFYDINQEEVPGRSFYGLSRSEPTVLGSGTIKYKIGSVLGVFKLFAAKGISEQNQDTDVHVDRLVKKTQNAARIFDRYFEGPDDATRYQIQAGVEKFLVSIPEDMTVWDKITELSLYENFFPSITDDGNFQWTDRNETIAVQWVFNGAGSFDNIYGINIIDITQQLGVDRVFTRVGIEINDGTIRVKEINWTPGDSSVPDLYGAKVFEYEATPGELNNALGDSIADRLLAATQTPHNIFKINTTFIPHLRVNDRVTLNFKGSEAGDAFINDSSILDGPDLLDGPRGAIDLVNRDCKISELQISLDTLQCQFELTEL
jgi:hypothetical protein